MGLEGLAQHEAGLREWAFGGVNHEDDTVDHGQAALNLAAEVGVAGGVDNVDGDAVLKAQGLRGGATVVDGGVLGENGDALFSFKIAGVHDTLAGLFDRVALGERSGLPEHCVNQRGLSVIDVCDDRDVSQVGTRGHMWTPQMWIQIYACWGRARREDERFEPISRTYVFKNIGSTTGNAIPTLRIPPRHGRQVVISATSGRSICSITSDSVY